MLQDEAARLQQQTEQAKAALAVTHERLQETFVAASAKEPQLKAILDGTDARYAAVVAKRDACQRELACLRSQLPGKDPSLQARLAALQQQLQDAQQTPP